MGQNMKGNGMTKLVREMEWEFKFGLMGLSMRDFGKMIRLTAEED